MSTVERLGEILQAAKSGSMDPVKVLTSLCDAIEELRTELMLSSIEEDPELDTNKIQLFREQMYEAQKETRTADLLFHYNKKFLLEYSKVVRYNIVVVLVRILREREEESKVPDIWYKVLNNHGSL